MAARMAGVGRVTVSLRRSIAPVDCRVVVPGQGKLLVDTVSSTLIASGVPAPLLRESGQQPRWNTGDRAGLAARGRLHPSAGQAGIVRRRQAETSPHDHYQIRRPNPAM